nr:kinesin-related protein 8-like isoform X1 [Bombus vancouverensis nearcticus]
MESGVTEMTKKNRKRKLEEEEQSMIDWERENILTEEIRNEMEFMWEIPQIFHFLHLTKEALNIPHLSMYEMERMFLIPRASRQLANIMTSLLSSPVFKAKLRKIPPMPYEFWTNILAYKMKSWFKIYEAKHQNAVKVLETIGVEPEFWNVFPDAPLLNGKDFEELTFRQKVWLLKTVCDTVMHTRKTVQEEIAKQPWENQFETVLGTDRYGARYIYFPQFLKSDLRVYRHCLDNNILSTVKPIKPKIKTQLENKALVSNDLMKRKTKHRKRKSRWSNGLPPKTRRKPSKSDDKHLNDCKCSSDSAIGSLINEDTNFSSTSICSNNNNNSSNNNNINLNTINVERSESLSKCSEVSTMSDKTCKSTKSSGYDTNNSVRDIPGKKSSQKMFKGFSDSSNNIKCNIDIINGILSGLKCETVEEKATENNDISLTQVSQDKLKINPTKQSYLDAMDVHINKGDSVDRTIDNLSSTSKTDDEKLNEIISAENLKLNDKNPDNMHGVRETHQTSITSKSDDEKLNETRTHVRKQQNDTSLSEDKVENRILRRNGRLAKEQKSNNEQSNQIIKNETTSSDDKDLSLSELRSMLQKEAMEDDFSFDENSEIKYNLRKLNHLKTKEWKQETEDFNTMLSELSVSKFQLVADSVNSLRDLISTFSPKNGSLSTDTDGETELISPCEVKLVKRMTELLSSLEEMEPALQESMKRARGKLQKEWTNFKEGSAEDQDSSGEGLGSNWWILGSQGCQLSTSGDATLQTLPQPTISPAGSQNVSNKIEEVSVSHAEHNKKECTESQDESLQNETQREQSERDEGNSHKNAGIEEETKEDSSEEEQQTRRVLRARGISSYTEQLYSDDEIEENELEEWTDVEAVYAAPSTQTGPSTSYLTPKVRYSDDRTNEEEDSDQDWILPSSRKRKNKRPSANRRLKSFQHKLQSIKINALQDAAESKVTSSTKLNSKRELPRIREIQICKPKKLTNSESPNNNNTADKQEAVVESKSRETVPSTEISCKVETIASVHSELDIKDEGPIYDSTPNQFDSCYTVNSNYVMLKTEPNPMNYYVMQSNSATVVPQSAIVQSGPMVSSIIPPIQQGYYVQGGQNYIIQNSQTNFVPSQPFQPQGPQMIAPQQFVNHPGYVPYMVATTQPPTGYITTGQQILSQEMPQNPPFSVQSNPTSVTKPLQNRYSVPRQSYPHPNGVVIRSSMSIRGNTPRLNNSRVMKNVQQQRTPVRMQKPKKPTTSLENTGQKTTSLIVLSDSDDEIEMIITEKTGPETEAEKAKNTSRRNIVQTKQKSTLTSNVTEVPTKGVIPPQIIQRMNQGGISITPVKPTPPVQNANTQLVVVVNETGSHYALALPNGSKLILTPEQVAQIRASNGGKLIL